MVNADQKNVLPVNSVSCRPQRDLELRDRELPSIRHLTGPSTLLRVDMFVVGAGLLRDFGTVHCSVQE